MEPSLLSTQPEARDRRSEDRHGVARLTCWLARRLSEFWEFVDKRQIDVHLTAQCIIIAFIVGTMKLTEWGLHFSEKWFEAAMAGHAIAGSEVSLVLAAVLGPWSLMVTAVLGMVVSFYFKARN